MLRNDITSKELEEVCLLDKVTEMENKVRFYCGI